MLRTPAPGRAWLISTVLTMLLVFTGCFADSAGAAEQLQSTLTSGQSLGDAAVAVTKAAAPAALTGSGRTGVSLDASFEDRPAVITLYGQSVRINGALEHVEDPVIQWHGKNLALDFFYASGTQYQGLGAVDAALLVPGQRYVISFSANKSFSYYTQELWQEAQWLRYDPAAGRASFTATVSPDLDPDLLARGSRRDILLNETTYTDIVLRELQIERDTGGSSAYEPFCGGNIVLDGVTLRGSGQARDRLFLDTDGLWKIERNVEKDGLRAKAAPSLETLADRYQYQLGAIYGKEGVTLGVYAGESVVPAFTVSPATSRQEQNITDSIGRLHGGFLTLRDGRMYDEQGREFSIQGISSGDVWYPYFNIADHSQSIYRQIARIGFNTVRIELNYKKFERVMEDNTVEFNRQALADLEKSVENARMQGLRCIIDIHIPQGGWHAYEDGEALFDPSSEALQQRYIAMWTSIATHFADNDNVIGYGLCNEPAVPWQDSDAQTMQVYQSVIQRTVNAIRGVDSRHFLSIMDPANLPEKELESAMPWKLRDTPVISDPKGLLMLEYHNYFNTKTPYGEKNICIYPNWDNIEASKNVVYDDWSADGYASSDKDGWAVMEIEVSLKADEYDLGRFTPFLSAEGGDVYVKRLTVERRRPGKQPVVVLDASSSNRSLSAAYSGLPQETVASPWGDGDVWRFPAENSGEPVKNLISNLAAERGDVFMIRVELRGAPGAQIHARIKTYVSSYLPTEKGASVLYFNDQSFLKEILSAIKKKADSLDAVIFLGEIGIDASGLNDYSNYEQWVKDTMQEIKKDHIHFSKQGTMTEALGLWRDLQGDDKNLDLERVRLLREYAFS